MIVDAHAHFQPSSATQPTASAEELVSEMDRVGVACAVVSPIVGSIPEDNDALAEAARSHPGRIFGYLNLDPRRPDEALSELERWAEAPIFVGVKLHPSNHAYFPFLEEYFSVYEEIESRGLPVLWHSGSYPSSTPLQIAYVASKFPGMPCVLGHFGLPDLAPECFAAAEFADNILADCTVNARIPLLRAWIERFGATRMLWGSDFPLYDAGYELERVQHFAEGPARQAILGGNARTLFDLPGSIVKETIQL